QIVAACAIPVFRKKAAQADRDHPMLLRQRSEHRVPRAEIAERAVDADQRRAVVGAPADIEIGHVASVDGKRLHLLNPPPGTPARSRNISAAPVRTSDAWCPGSSRCANPQRWKPARAAPAAAYPWSWRRR